MNIPLFISLIAFLSLAALWLGKRANQPSSSSDDYFLMGRKLGLFPLVMTLLATQVGGGALLGAAEEAYTQGWKVIFYPLGMVLGLIILGLGYGAKMRKLNISTVPEIFEKIYNSTKLRKIGSALSIASLFFILIGQAIAARKFFTTLEFPGSNYLFIAFWLVLIGYTVMGGLKAVVNTDILQAGFILIALAIAIFASAGTSINESMATELPQLRTPWATWLFLPLLFMLIEQDMGQRCFAAKNPRIVSIAAILSASLLLAVAFVPIYFGTIAGKMGITIPQGSSVLITSVKAFTNPIVATIVICAILMAVVSTADSLLCSISLNISCDFDTLKNSSKLITLLIGFATLGLSYLFDNVVVMLMFSYQLAISLLFVPITMAVWQKNPKKTSAITAMCLGSICFICLNRWNPSFPKELLTVAIAFAGFQISEKLSKKEVVPSTSKSFQ